MKEEFLEIVGELLAGGYSNSDIVNALEAQGLSREEAVNTLKGVYRNWQDTRTSLDLNESDITEWHIYLRQQLLRHALENTSPQGIRVALQVLDSLAAIQGVVSTQTSSVPLSIVLKEETADGKQEAGISSEMDEDRT